MVAAVVGTTAAGGVMLACGSSDATSTAEEEGGVRFGDGDSGTTGDPADQEPNDGVFRAHNDAGCPVKYQGPRPGTVVTSIPRAAAPGAIAWETPGNALTVDGQFARAVLDEGQESEHLRVTGYGFNLPASVTIKGVVVQLKRRGHNAIVDGQIELWLGGTAAERPKFMASGWPEAIGTHHYGQEVDTWGNDLTPAMIGDPGFGTQIWAKRRVDAGTGPVAAEVESLIITVWYCD
jgi:hypothetical protein